MAPEPTQKERIGDLEDRMTAVEALGKQILLIVEGLQASQEKRNREVCEHALRGFSDLAATIRQSKPIAYGIGSIFFSLALLVGSMAVGSIDTPWGAVNFLPSKGGVVASAENAETEEAVEGRPAAASTSVDEFKDSDTDTDLLETDQ